MQILLLMIVDVRNGVVVMEMVVIGSGYHPLLF
jgi:hypothetical protein